MSAPDRPGPDLEVDLYAVVTIHGVAGQAYRVEYSDAPAGENGTWHFLAIVRLIQGRQLYLDASASARTQRFYRVAETDGHHPKLTSPRVISFP